MFIIRMHKRLAVGLCCAFVIVFVVLVGREDANWFFQSLSISPVGSGEIWEAAAFSIGNVQKIVPEFNKSLFGVEMEHLSRMTYTQDPPFTYLDTYKNPCWVEHITDASMRTFQSNPFRGYATKEASELDKVYAERLVEQSKPWRLRCLPYCYLLGVTKSGTTDLYHVITKRQPRVHGPWVKEPMYWNWRRYPQGTMVQKDKVIPHMQFEKYVNMFDHVANRINQSGTGNEDIIVDGSSYMFWEDNSWTSHPDNVGLTEPKYTTPMALNAAQPQAKLIVMLRNPIDRIYSNYVMHFDGKDRSPEHFDSLVTPALHQYEACLETHSIRACAYNASLSHNTFPITLRASMYVVFMLDWLAVFPKQQLLVIKSEDYYDNRMKIMEEIFSFLGLDGVDEKTAQQITDKGPSMKRSYDHMLPSTKERLDRFYKPYNKHLARVLHRQLWD